MNELRYTPVQATPYFVEPGISLVSHTVVDYYNGDTRDFLAQHDESWIEYLGEFPTIPIDHPDNTDLYQRTRDLTDAELLTKFSGQLDYLSFGPRRTMNKDAQGYIDRAKQQKHGNLLEQADFAFLIWGVSRSLTHELVRHRLFSPSQTSQRYVDKVRFVERPESQVNELLHNLFITRIDQVAAQYYRLLNIMQQLEEDGNNTPVLSTTQTRIAIRQQARALLPNETETSIIVKGNVRTWRHFLEKRARPEAEPEIRKLAMLLYNRLIELAPFCFDDYVIKAGVDNTGSYGYLTTDYEGV